MTFNLFDRRVEDLSDDDLVEFQLYVDSARDDLAAARALLADEDTDCINDPLSQLDDIYLAAENELQKRDEFARTRESVAYDLDEFDTLAFDLDDATRIRQAVDDGKYAHIGVTDGLTLSVSHDDYGFDDGITMTLNAHIVAAEFEHFDPDAGDWLRGQNPSFDTFMDQLSTIVGDPVRLQMEAHGIDEGEPDNWLGGYDE